MQPFEQLEKEFGDSIECPNCVAVASGTAALHLALEAFRLPNLCNVIVPNFTMVACPRAVMMAGLTPVFIDCTDDLLINPADVENLVRYSQHSQRVNVLMAVHIYGRMCNTQKLSAFADIVVEDMAEVHNVKPHPCTDAACWSFYKNKIIHGEEGGMIAFRNPDHALIARELRSLGFNARHDFFHRSRGVNARMSNLHAEPILKSLRNVKQNVFHRECLIEKYNSIIPEKWHMPARQSPWVYDLRIPKLEFNDHDAIVRKCLKYGIQARHAFKPMTFQSEYRDASADRSNATRLSQEVIYLPVSEMMTLANAGRNAEIFVQIVKEILHF